MDDLQKAIDMSKATPIKCDKCEKEFSRKRTLGYHKFYLRAQFLGEGLARISGC